jgi:hypothetical protein
MTTATKTCRRCGVAPVEPDHLGLGGLSPRDLRSDNGPEFVPSAILRWTTAEGIETAHIAPGKPCQNDTDEIFNGHLREECLSMEWFRTRRAAAAIHRDLAPALQRGPAPLKPRLFDTDRIQSDAHDH